MKYYNDNNDTGCLGFFTQIEPKLEIVHTSHNKSTRCNDLFGGNGLPISRLKLTYM